MASSGDPAAVAAAASRQRVVGKVERVQLVTPFPPQTSEWAK